MYNVSDTFKNYIKLPNREFDVKAVINDAVTYDKTSIINFDVYNSLTADEDFIVGGVVSSKLVIAVKTTDIIESNSKITPYLRLNGTSGWSEWVPMGSFYIDARGYKNGVYNFVCYDRLMFAQQAYVSALTFPATQLQVLDEICSQLEITKSVGINASYMIPYVQEGVSIHDMLSYIAACHGSNVRLTKDNYLTFVKTAKTSTPVITVGPSDYAKVELTNPQKAYTRAVCTYNTLGETLESGEGTDNNTLKFHNPYETQTMLDALVGGLSTEAAISVDSEAIFYYDFTLGFTNGIVTDLSANNPDVPASNIVKGGSGGELNGTDSFVTVPNSTGYPYNGLAITMEAVAMLSTNEVQSTWTKSIVGKPGNGSDFDMVFTDITVTSCRIKFYINSGISISTGVLPKGVFYHIVCVYNSPNVYLYVNGTLRASRSDQPNRIINSNQVGIGYQPFRSGEDHYLYGTIKQCAIYSTAWNSSKVTLRYNGLMNNGLLAKYSFESNFTDLTGNGYHLSQLGSVSFVPSSRGKGVRYDNAMDGLYLNNDVLTGIFTGLNPYTVSFWMKPSYNHTGLGGEMVKVTNVVDGYATLLVSRTQDGKLHFIRTQSTPSVIQDNLTSNATIDLNTWYFVTCTFDGVTKRLYINGELDNSQDSTVTPSVFGGFWFGLGGWSPQFGDFDELSVYSRAISESEVKNIMSYDGLYRPFRMDWRGAVWAEVGDRIDIDIPNEDLIHSVITRETLIFKGGLKVISEATSYSPQESEFNYQGSLKRYLQQVDKTSLKEAQPYYGFTVSRSQGLIVEKSDGSSKLIANSDKLAFQANGVDKIFFDPISGKYKFVGTIEADGGDFTGTIHASGGSFDGYITGTLQTDYVSLGQGESTPYIEFIPGGGSSGDEMTILAKTDKSTFEFSSQDLLALAKIKCGDITCGDVNGFNLSTDFVRQSGEQQLSFQVFGGYLEILDQANGGALIGKLGPIITE